MEIGSYVIIGAVVSLITQLIKEKWGTESKTTLGVVIGVSVLAGSAYYLIGNTSLLEPIISILGFAGAVYTYIIQRFEN